MKPTHSCPKCRSGNIARVPGRVKGLSSSLRSFLPVGLTLFNAVPVTRYVCCNCGFLEFWVDGPADLAKLGSQWGSQQ